jgi:hypothetical protein
MIIIIIWNAAVLLHALGSTVAFSVLREPVGNLLQVFFVNFLTFSLYLWRETTYRVFATNSLSMVYVFVLTSVQVRRIIYIYIYIEIRQKDRTEDQVAALQLGRTKKPY